MTRFLSHALSALAVIGLGAGLGAGAAHAEVANLCPNQATFGGYGSNTETPFPGTQDAICSAISGETIAISTDTDYAKLQWNASNTPNYPVIDLAELTGLSASVNFTSGSPSDSPYFLLAFHDPTGSLGVSSSDQILAIEFSSLGISGPATMTMDPATTKFDLYDNTTNSYIPGYGQANAMSLDAILGADPVLATTGLEGTWLGIGLAGGCTPACGESLAVDTMTESYTPEPGTMWLMGGGLAAAFTLRRKLAARRA